MPKLSRYFANLNSSYHAELDDLRTDSEGNNVFKSRLAQKRAQLPQLLSMLQFAPEMVAAAFHGGFQFKSAKAMETLVSREPNKFPEWSDICRTLVIQPWAQALVDTVLTDPHGKTFLITTAGLEYLHYFQQAQAAQAPVNEPEQQTRDHREDDDEDNEHDLDEAGADWLAEQGFDRKE